jgi:hypothetical protein
MSTKTKPTSALARLDKARTMLAEARSLSEVKEIRDRAEAAKVYVKAAHMGRESQVYASEISLLASHKAGTILKQLPRAKPKAKGGRVRDSDYFRTLNETRTPYRTAQHWQKLAGVPEEIVHKYIAFVRKANKGEISAAGLLRLVRQKSGKKQSPYDSRITVHLKRHEYACISGWAKASFSPTDFHSSEEVFIRAVLAEFFKQTHMGDLIDETKSIQVAVAEWLERGGTYPETSEQPE